MHPRLSLFLVALLVITPAGLRAAPPAMKPISLLNSEEDFRSRWLKGVGTVVYDAKTKAVHIFGDVGVGGDVGGFAYKSNWDELAFSIAIEKPRLGSHLPLFLGLNDEKIDLTSAIKKPGTFNLRIVKGSGDAVGVFVDGNLAAKATLSDSKDLRLRFRSDTQFGGTLHLANVRIKASPEPEPPPKLPDQKNPAGMKQITLLQSQDDLEKHFKKGKGTLELDPKSNILTFEKTDGAEIGYFLYNAPWEELQFDISIPNGQPNFTAPSFCLSFGGNYVSDNAGEAFELIHQVPGPGKYRIRAVYFRNKTLAVFVNDKPVTPTATILNDSMVSPLKLFVYSDFRGSIHLANVKIKALAEEQPFRSEP